MQTLGNTRPQQLKQAQNTPHITFPPKQNPPKTTPKQIPESQSPATIHKLTPTKPTSYTQNPPPRTINNLNPKPKPRNIQNQTHRPTTKPIYQPVQTRTTNPATTSQATYPKPLPEILNNQTLNTMPYKPQNKITKQLKHHVTNTKSRASNPPQHTTPAPPNSK